MVATVAPAQESLQAPGWDVAIRMPEAPDLNPDPHIVEIELEARVAPFEVQPGLVVEAWTYNGMIPGPMIRVNVGDRLIVQFTFTRIGGDGGLMEYSVEKEALVLGAGERADIIVYPRGDPGEELMLISQLYDRGYGSTELRTYENLVAITITDQPEYKGPPLPEVRRTITPFDARWS